MRWQASCFWFGNIWTPPKSWNVVASIMFLVLQHSDRVWTFKNMVKCDGKHHILGVTTSEPHQKAEVRWQASCFWCFDFQTGSELLKNSWNAMASIMFLVFQLSDRVWTFKNKVKCNGKNHVFGFATSEPHQKAEMRWQSSCFWCFNFLTGSELKK